MAALLLAPCISANSALLTNPAIIDSQQLVVDVATNTASLPVLPSSNGCWLSSVSMDNMPAPQTLQSRMPLGVVAQPALHD
jgi:hypothetical protein